MKILALVSTLFFSHALMAVEVMVGENAYNSYTAFLAGRDVSDISTFETIESNREVIELIIFQKALALGGFQEPVVYTPQALSYLRRIRLVSNGTYIAWGNTAWYNDAKLLPESVYITAPVIQKGEYIVGLYTHPNNNKALQAKNLTDIQQLTALTNRNFSADWTTLQSLKLQKVISNPNWYAFARVLLSGRADFMLSPFQAGEEKRLAHNQYYADGSIKESIDLVPIPSVQLYLDDSRHWLVSKSHPKGELIFQALQIGLKKMNDNGTRRKLLVQSGFIPKDLDSRLTLNQNSQTMNQNLLTKP